MKVKIVLGTLVVGLVALVSQAQTGSIQISAYGNSTKPADLPVGNSSRRSAGTGRAMGSGSFQNPLEGLLSKPIKFRTSGHRDSPKTPKYIVYPSASQSIFSDRTSGNNAVAMDRFAPGEAYGGTVYKIVKAREEKIKNGYQYQKPNAAFDDSKTNAPSPTTQPPPPPPPAAAITVQALPPPITPPTLPPLIVGPTPSPITSPPAPAPTAATPIAPPPSNQYIPPSDLYLFAPNVHSHYPQQMNGDAQFSGVSSYLPPPAGSSDDAPPADSNPSPPSPPSNQYIPPEGLFQFPPNIHSHYHPAPPEDGFQFNGISSYLPPPAGPSDAYLPPSSDDSPSTPPPSDSNDMIGTIPIGPDSPYPSYLPPSGPPPPAPPAPMKKPPPPPPAPTMAKDMSAQPVELPFSFHDHETYFPYDHYPHDHFPHDHHYPEYIFDHDHHHDELPPPTTAAPPPPPPPPVDAGTARVKNYSYYYLSRTLWYVPLYFTLYFCFYVLILILRSIARHKVNYPNQWTGRSLQGMQSISNDEVVNKADIMATFVMKQIDDFKEKYL